MAVFFSAYSFLAQCAVPCTAVLRFLRVKGLHLNFGISLWQRDTVGTIVQLQLDKQNLRASIRTFQGWSWKKNWNPLSTFSHIQFTNVFATLFIYNFWKFTNKFSKSQSFIFIYQESCRTWISRPFWDLIKKSSSFQGLHQRHCWNSRTFQACVNHGEITP